MKTQFNLIKSSNQSIKISCEVLNSSSLKDKLIDYKYNNLIVFKYSIFIKDSKVNLKLIFNPDKPTIFYKKLLGSFIYDYSIKFGASFIEIKCYDSNLLDFVILGFKQKDFSYSIYKKNSPKEKFKTSYKIKESKNKRISF